MLKYLKVSFVESDCHTCILLTLDILKMSNDWRKMSNYWTNQQRQVQQVKEEWEDYTCDICGEELATTEGLAFHKRTHSRPSKPPKSFICDHPGCGKAFDNKEQLNGHMHVHG